MAPQIPPRPRRIRKPYLGAISLNWNTGAKASLASGDERSHQAEHSERHEAGLEDDRCGEQIRQPSREEEERGEAERIAGDDL